MAAAAASKKSLTAALNLEVVSADLDLEILSYLNPQDQLILRLVSKPLSELISYEDIRLKMDKYTSVVYDAVFVQDAPKRLYDSAFGPFDPTKHIAHYSYVFNLNGTILTSTSPGRTVRIQGLMLNLDILQAVVEHIFAGGTLLSEETKAIIIRMRDDRAPVALVDFNINIQAADKVHRVVFSGVFVAVPMMNRGDPATGVMGFAHQFFLHSYECNLTNRFGAGHGIQWNPLLKPSVRFERALRTWISGQAAAIPDLSDERVGSWGGWDLPSSDGSVKLLYIDDATAAEDSAGAGAPAEGSGGAGTPAGGSGGAAEAT